MLLAVWYSDGVLLYSVWRRHFVDSFAAAADKHSGQWQFIDSDRVVSWAGRYDRRSPTIDTSFQSSPTSTR